MDAVDREIVRLLHADGRMSQERVAREVRLSRPAVHERIKRLEERGVIRGYRALVDWGALGQPLTAFIWVRTEGACGSSAEAIMGLRCEGVTVEECHRVTGEWCLLLKVRAASPLALQEVLEEIRDIPEVGGTMTTLALSTLYEDNMVRG
ncbi:Lrp/AsnC family transcriptional regulator [Rubrobacter taiwanensis]|uniref:Lrp/AsnC family transcriptional regulator n=1 Tax=Rubrobacter taiwanensis TaxID=185139 RepID=A0A4R1BQD2_9ACTN|nr:Lrp/AsnC family transcriptional regulator [Rubrobacter taiwanensis]TCJ19939.1 Lrp/AsnC family transcriptional regulator [Rubrobacter taiwanensis]